MKHLFSTLLLLLAGVVCMQAQSLSIGGKDIDLTKDGTYNIGDGTATFYLSTKTLELKNISLTNNNITGKKLGSITSYFYITLKSDLTIKNNSFAIRFDNSYVVINAKNYKISIDNSATTMTDRAAIDGEESELHIWNAILDVDGGASKAIFGNSQGMLWLSCVYANLKGSHAIYGFKSVVFDDCLLFTEGTKYVSGTGVTDADDVVVKTLQIRPLLMCGVRLLRTEADYTSSGVATWTKSSKTLTLGWDYTATSGYPCVANYGIDGLVIKVDENRLLKSENANAIELYKPTTITGNSKLTIEAPGYTAIYPMKADAKITISNADLECSGSYGIDGSGYKYDQTDLEINNSKISVTATEDAMCRLKSVKMVGCDVNTAETPAFFNPNATASGFTDISGTGAKRVVIDKPTKYYPVYVCGKQVNNLNASNILVNGLTAGKINFLDRGDYNYLGFNAVTLNNNSDHDAIMLTDKATTLRFDGGTTTINHNSSTSYCDAIYANLGGILRMEGDNKVVINAKNSTNNCGVRLFDTNLEVDLKGLDIKSTGFAIFGANGTESVTLTKRYYTCQYTLQGNVSPLSAAQLTLEDMDFDSDYNPGCYFADKKVYQNGSSAAVNDVRFSAISQTYGVTVAGTPVTNCNMKGVGSPYLGTSNPTAVTFDGDKTLTLRGAAIDTGTDFVNGIRNSSIDGLTINVLDINNITSSHSGYNSDNVPLNVSANTTITGSGRLAIRKLPVSCNNNANLTIKDATWVGAYLFKANTSTSNSELLIDNSNVEIESGIFFFKDMNWQNAYLNEPAGGRYDTAQRKFFDASGNTASKIVFGDKNHPTGIESVDADAEVKAVYDASGRQTGTAKRGLKIVRMSDGSVRKVITK